MKQVKQTVVLHFSADTPVDEVVHALTTELKQSVFNTEQSVLDEDTTITVERTVKV